MLVWKQSICLKILILKIIYKYFKKKFKKNKILYYKLSDACDRDCVKFLLNYLFISCFRLKSCFIASIIYMHRYVAHILNKLLISIYVRNVYCFYWTHEIAV